MMQPLDKSLRNQLERTIKTARDSAEDAARATLEQLGVGEAAPFAHLSEQDRELRRKLRVHGRQLGDSLSVDKIQSMDRLIEEAAYEHWHRMLFARFLAENNLLMYPDPDDPVAVTLEECEDLAADEGAANGWELAARFAARMLPQIFRPDSPVFQLMLPPEYQQKLERLVADLPPEVFTASDSLGWVYQFWQAKKKDEVNASEVKIGSRELPAVTQLFTEPYMVSFLLDNSLGAWWAMHRLSDQDWRESETEDVLRQRAAIPGVPLKYLRFVRSPESVTRTSDFVTRASSPEKPGQDDLVTNRKTSFDERTLEKHQGEHLPHWTCQGAVYHVVFRLADSVPRSRWALWSEERIHAAVDGQAAQQQARYRKSQEMDDWLDSGHGACHLRQPRIAELVANALKHFDGERYRLHAWCVMPNHVHVIVEPIGDNPLFKIIHSWKSFTANTINRHLGLSGTFWQADAYNHIIRTQKEYDYQVRYVWHNPDKANLPDWPWRWAADLDSDLVTRASSPEKPDQDDPATFVTKASSLAKPGQDDLITQNQTQVWAPAAGNFENWPSRLNEFKLLDPCCGSGHFLVAALLMLVPLRMTLENLSAQAAVDAVLRDNLHGLELDQRCVELAAFALALTAWKYPDAGGYRALPTLNIACSGLSVSVAKEEWKQLGFGKHNLTIALDWLHDTFQDAPVLGSLLDPAKTRAASLVQWDELSATLEQALQQEQNDEQQEAAVVAQGLARAATLLAGRYQWVITNVPYLTRGKQSERLRDFCEKHYPAARNDLATVFLDRCLELAALGGTVSVVLPQNWLFLTSYKKFREKLLKNDTWHWIARLGPGAFETISGEVVKAILISLSRGRSTGAAGGLFGDAGNGNLIRGVDVSEPRTAAEKAAQLQTAEIRSVEQVKQLENPDARIAFNKGEDLPLLSRYADALNGMHGADSLRFRFMFWEIIDLSIWDYFHNTSDSTQHFAGLEYVFYWTNNGQIHRENPKAFVKGESVWGKSGVAVSMMRELPVSLYTGEKFDISCSPIIPKDSNYLPAIWCFCSSPDYNEAVRRIDQSLKVTNATLVKVPFDLAHWQQVAAEKYPHGLPKPYSDDPTQWIFHGHPCGSVIWDEEKKCTAHGPLRTDDTVLQIAVARLLGYRWPAEGNRSKGVSPLPSSDRDGLATPSDQDGLATELAAEQREWVERCQRLEAAATVDDDGIVCIPPVGGEASAADRLLNLLAAAYGDTWSNDTLATLLKSADHAGKTLETWLREKFFTQHCKLFQHRPFIWHLWDGRLDGFAALVNYHQLDYKTLETLIYTYLGDWISRQKRDVENGIDGAQERLAAAEALKKKLELILEGEAPYDIFVRWKPIEEQPIGWNPDLNDGVRFNIRPFLSVSDVGKKGAGVLRDKPKSLHWEKDRGSDVPSAPWYELGLQYGGKAGDRINDHHLTLNDKRAARTKKGA